VEEDATSPSANDVTATNSIFKGVGVDVRTLTPSTGPASITVSHCDYALTGISNHGTLHADATDIHTPPIFVNAPTDYREAAGSPTINAGAADTGSDTDLAGLPRVLGSAPDIGAFERAQPPATHGLKVTRTTKHSAHLTVKANPEGLATTVKILASHHHHSTTRSVGTGRTAKKVKLTVKGLKRHTKYQFHAVATNAAGHAHSAKVKAKTR
jgi:hypothetical protein